jgi:drug/metabolite transporter (DMT)-like permease
MVSGQFHSGPVSSIRFVGYVGLGVFLILLIVLAKSAYQVIEKSRGTPYQFLTLFIGIPIMIYPFFFLFVFGAYEHDIINSFFYAGMLKLMNTSLNNYRKKAFL